MPVLTVGSIKGGVGKTTIATNLAILYAQNALDSDDILLVDADPQETASDFTEMRGKQRHSVDYTCVQLSGMQVKTQVRKLRDKYSMIIIDAGGQDSVAQRAALTVSDVLLVPFLPRSFDLWTVDAILGVVDETLPVNETLQTLFFLNRGDPFGSDMEESFAYLREMASKRADTRVLTESIGTRKAFAQAASQGLGVTELRPKDAKAEGEILALCQRLGPYLYGNRKTAHA